MQLLRTYAGLCNPIAQDATSPPISWQGPLVIRSVLWPCSSMQTFTQDRTATGSVSVVRDLSRLDLKTSFVQSLLSAKSSHPLLCDAGLFFQPAAWHPETLRNSLAEIVYICDPLSHFGELLGGRARCTSFIDSQHCPPSARCV